VVGVDGEAADAGSRARLEGPFRERAVKEGHERLWQVMGQWPETGSKAGAEYECLMHGSALTWGTRHFKSWGGNFSGRRSKLSLDRPVVLREKVHRDEGSASRPLGFV
jgi:hypothetical protein